MTDFKDVLHRNPRCQFDHGAFTKACSYVQRSEHPNLMLGISKRLFCQGEKPSPDISQCCVVLQRLSGTAELFPGQADPDNGPVLRAKQRAAWLYAEAVSGELLQRMAASPVGIQDLR